MAIEGIFYVYAKVGDLKRAKEFYGDTLGWRLHTDEPAVAGFWFGTGYLVLGLEKSGSPGERGAGGMHVAVRVSDLEAEHARLTERGVGVSPIQRQPWGESNFSFRDPEGYRWEYGQAM
jgi:catechol 2,3-dioxygenase-like lactoylglutathione lyase family enzyme